VFSHGLPYYWDIIQVSYPEVSDLIKKIYDGVEFLGTDEEINLKEIADRLMEIKTELSLTREEYFKFAEEKGVKKEELLKKCIFRLMGPLLPYIKEGSRIHEIREEWLSLSEASLVEVVGKTRELIAALSEDSDWHRFRANSNELFLLNQMLEDAEKDM
jgi:transcriptional regulator